MPFDGHEQQSHFFTGASRIAHRLPYRATQDCYLLNGVATYRSGSGIRCIEYLFIYCFGVLKHSCEGGKPRVILWLAPQADLSAVVLNDVLVALIVCTAFCYIITFVALNRLFPCNLNCHPW